MKNENRIRELIEEKHQLQQKCVCSSSYSSHMHNIMPAIAAQNMYMYISTRVEYVDYMQK